IEAGEDPVLDRARLDLARPAYDARHAETTLAHSALGVLEGGHAAVGPGEHFGAVVRGEDDDRIVRFTPVVQMLQPRVDTVVQLRHSGLFEAVIRLSVLHRAVLLGE